LVSAAQVKEAYERIEESLATLMIDFNVVSITASPIVEIFPYREEDVQSPVQKAPKFEEETTHTPLRQVFSASGTDTDEDVFLDDSEISDETESV
jgi:hypothetical protein